jgi:ubiquitin-conjugating enzyme E2 J2
MASKECVSRLQRELRELSQNPSPSILAAPSPADLLQWHYVLLGPEGTVYEGGVYHGKLVFPPTYPHAPPSIYMFTPSG